jgi:hypothetical protein
VCKWRGVVLAVRNRLVGQLMSMKNMDLVPRHHSDLIHDFQRDRPRALTQVRPAGSVRLGGWHRGGLGSWSARSGVLQRGCHELADASPWWAIVAS